MKREGSAGRERLCRARRRRDFLPVQCVSQRLIGSVAERAVTEGPAVHPLPLFVENTAAIFATDNLFPGSGTRRRCTRHLHVATGADSMLDRDYCGVAFALKKTFKETKQILIDFSRQFCAFPRQVFQAENPKAFDFSSRSAVCRAIDSLTPAAFFSSSARSALTLSAST